MKAKDKKQPATVKVSKTRTDGSKPTESASKANISTVSSITVAPEVSHGQVAERAYQLWQQDGYRHGRNEQHWFEAERLLKCGQ